MPKKISSPEPTGTTTIRCAGGSCPHVEIDWDKNEAVIIDDFGGECRFTSLSQLWSMASRISIAMCCDADTLEYED